MKIKESYILKKVMGSYMVMTTDCDSPNINVMQTINETGAFLWSLLEKDTTIEEMVKKMVAEYEIDEETAKRDITAFVDKLRNAQILSE